MSILGWGLIIVLGYIFIAMLISSTPSEDEDDEGDDDDWD